MDAARMQWTQAALMLLGCIPIMRSHTVREENRGRLGGPFQGFFKSLNKLYQRNTDCLADLAQFNQIQTAFARLIFGDERLGALDLGCQNLLAQTCIKARLPEQTLKLLLCAAVNGFGHLPMFILRVDQYPKTGYSGRMVFGSRCTLWLAGALKASGGGSARSNRLSSPTAQHKKINQKRKAMNEWE